MIRALEEHLASWFGRELAALAEQSAMFGLVRTIAGGVGASSLLTDEVQILVRVQGLAPVTDSGPRLTTVAPTIRLRARISLRILGPSFTVGQIPDSVVKPTGMHLHRTDLILLTLLALLQERPAPRPDHSGLPDLDEVQGRQASGAASISAGARQVRLAWSNIEAGEAIVCPENDHGLRQWDVPLQALCTFWLSPPADEGRVLKFSLDAERNIYIPAEEIPLSYFAGLRGALLAELAAYNLNTLGDLSRMGIARMAETAAQSRVATTEERAILANLTAIAETRHQAMSTPPSYSMVPELLALPVRTLLAPTPEETLTMTRLTSVPAVAAEITILALPVIRALKPEKQERIALGNFLVRKG